MNKIINKFSLWIQRIPKYQCGRFLMINLLINLIFWANATFYLVNISKDYVSAVIAGLITILVIGLIIWGWISKPQNVTLQFYNISKVVPFDFRVLSFYSLVINLMFVISMLFYL